jgi:peroxiredoxin
VKRLAQFEPQKAEMEAAGVQVAFVAAEKSDGMWKPGRFLEKHPISFPFLLDEDRAVTRLYGLHHAFGHDAVNIAHPATLVIDRAGVVRYLYRGDNQNDRAPIADVIRAAQTSRS